MHSRTRGATGTRWSQGGDRRRVQALQVATDYLTELAEEAWNDGQGFRQATASSKVIVHHFAVGESYGLQAVGKSRPRIGLRSSTIDTPLALRKATKSTPARGRLPM